MILSGYLGHQDKISFRFTTANVTAAGTLVIHFHIKMHYSISQDFFFEFVCLFNADPYDYLPPEEEAALTFQKGNMKSPLCKEITIVDDCDVEQLEEFIVGLELVEAECAEVEFHPNYTIVKIIDDDGPDGKLYYVSLNITHTPVI